MALKIWYDGSLVDESEAKVSVFDHGLLYGDGVFEGIRFYNGRVFRLPEHVDRLFSSAKAIMLDLPWSREEVIRSTLEVIQANQLRDGYVRLLVTRGVGSLGLSPDSCPRPSMIIIAADIQLYPESDYDAGLKVVTCATRRPTHSSLSPQVKSLNYLNNVMAKVEATRAGGREGLMLNEQGYVAECTGDNVFIVKKGAVFTPPVSDGGLDGITRGVIFELAEQLEVSIEEKTLTRFDIITADECFLTGTAAEVIPAVELDHRPIGEGLPGPVTAIFIEAYRALVRNSGTPIEVA
ncbi:MAG: branched-chain-amino-acid transaminase [Verrucomicrobiaceae bacterium]|jgi:branched-chain amino acid aminotransferase|nr:branched-chain-amino-acid transaminase [Verrucomicrobiaceae bacterium]